MTVKPRVLAGGECSRMTRKQLLRALVLTGLSALSVAAWAFDAAPAFADSARQQRYLALVHELRCVVCQNQSIGDSNADLAADLRHQVRELIQSGKSDDEIKHYMTDRYGDFILYKPRLSPQSLLLWLAPLILLLTAGWLIKRIVQRRAQEPLLDHDP
jgi:cytochrome c-type biogenesis protein CcmH